MRPSDWFVLVCGLALLWQRFPGSRKMPSRLGWLLAAAVIGAATFNVWDGLRRELLPAYVGIGLCVAATSSRPRAARLICAVSAASLLVALVWAYLWPVVVLPQPTGSFVVGTTTLELSPHRRVQLWYPSSDPLNGATAPYREDQTRTHWLQVFDRSRLTVTHAHTDAALSTEVATWPLILYVPSWDGQPTDNTVQSEELASHGFVVAALEAVDPGSAMDFSTQAGYQNTVSRAEARIVEGAAALTQALDQLTCLTADASGGRWVGRVDFGRVGVFGYSFGGAVAAEAAASDQRLRAIANLDGWLFGNAASLGVRQPFMTIADGGELTIVEDHSPAKPAGSDRQHINYYALFDHDKAYQLINGLAKNGGYYLTIAGMEHPKFSDAPLFAPRTLQRTSHGLAQRHAEAIINAYLVAFFDQALLGRTVPLLATKSAFDPMAVLHTYSTVGVADRDTRAVSATATAPCVK